MTLLNEINEDKTDVIDLTARDLDDNAVAFADAVMKNRNANQLLLGLCDFSDTTFQFLVDAICKRKNKFIFVDISTNQSLTQKSYAILIQLIGGDKVEELCINGMTNVIKDKSDMDELINLALRNNVILYIGDKTREHFEIALDKSYVQQSVFKPRDFRDISKVLAAVFSDSEIRSQLLPKLSKLMIYHLNKAIGKCGHTGDEQKKDSRNVSNYNTLDNENFEDLNNTNIIISELPLFIRYKIMDVCLVNQLHKQLKINLPILNNTFKI